MYGSMPARPETQVLVLLRIHSLVGQRNVWTKFAIESTKVICIQRSIWRLEIKHVLA